MAIQLLQTEPALDKLSMADNPWSKRNLLPFLGDALQWFSGRVTMKDMTEIKQQINLLMQEQTKQQEILVHVISILNVTWYTTQVNKQKPNKVMDGKQKYNYTIQYHRNSDTASQRPPNIHLCLQYIGLPLGLPHIHEIKLPHMHNGLCQCSYNQYTITRYMSCRRTQKYAQTHWITTTFNNASKYIIRWHTPILPVSQDTHASSRWIFLLLRYVPI